MPAHATAALCGTSEAPAPITPTREWVFPLDGRLVAARTARRVIRRTLAGLRIAEDVALAGSELVTNSVLYSRSYGQPHSITVEISLSDTALLLTVTDRGKADQPVWLELDTDADFAPDGLSVSGRGYTLVCGLVGEGGQVGYVERVWPRQERMSWALWSLR